MLRSGEDTSAADRQESSALGARDDKSPGNDEYPWDTFDPEWYLQHNYGRLRDDDSQILECLAEFFSGSGSGIGHRELKRGIDVGSGANLYPLLAMLPLCGRITLRERAASNCDWLRHEIKSYSPVWEPYWDKLVRWPLYQPVGEPRWVVGERARVERGSVFDLRRAAYDVGTMFFVAESITRRHDEFERATRCFLRSLKPNAPFAAAFMRESKGYEVAGVHFPAVAINERHVQECLESAGVRKSHVETIVSDTPLREDFAMMLVMGWTGRR
jgi:hypothetical protein